MSFEDSCRALQKLQLIDSGKMPQLPIESPRHDDAGNGVRFFRTMIADARMERLTLPRTFIGRSEIRASSFRETDLSESTANWNDFIKVNFSSADLSRSDFRGCLFKGVRFKEANLTGVDFRYCGFTACDFSDADLTGAKLTFNVGKSLRLTPEQQSVVDWQAEDGEEPQGG